jgi:hypothetical protein
MILSVKTRRNMPTYPVINKTTGEKQELTMTVSEYTQWRDENPDWDKDWSQGCASAQEVGDWRNKMNKTHPGWGEIMNKVSKMPGSNVEW